MKQTILTLFFAIIALGAAAQSPFSFQVKAGVGTANFHGKNVESDTRIAYKVGAGVNYELNRTWAVHTSLNFVSIGAREEIEYVGSANMNELYLQLPILMSARLSLGKNYSASLSAGPYVAYGVGGKTSGRVEQYDYDSSYDPNKYYNFRLATFGNLIDGKMGNNRFDAGLMFGVEMEYCRFTFGVDVQLGMLKVNDQLDTLLQGTYAEKFSPKNLASFFTLGYKF